MAGCRAQTTYASLKAESKKAILSIIQFHDDIGTFAFDVRRSQILGGRSDAGSTACLRLRGVTCSLRRTGVCNRCGRTSDQEAMGLCAHGKAGEIKCKKTGLLTIYTTLLLATESRGLRTATDSMASN